MSMASRPVAVGGPRPMYEPPVGCPAMALGRDVLLEVLRTEGVAHVFGNPGSTELPLIDALADADDLHYVLALQEATATGMADGYAQASGRPSFLNLHTSAGLGNAVGNLTNAKANGTPMVVTAGQQDVTAEHAAERTSEGNSPRIPGAISFRRGRWAGVATLGSTRP